MAEDEKKIFPLLGVKNWFALRKKFKITIPREVTSSYLASALNMTEFSARRNILPYLKATGIIDNDGKTNDRTIQWRDDTKYKIVCEKILKELYPQELLDLAPQNDLNRDVIQSWFSNNTGGGASLVGKQVAFYIMLSEGDLNKEEGSIANIPKKTKKGGDKKETDKKINLNNKFVKTNNQKPSQEFLEDSSTEIRRNLPQFHFNIQIVLPENASSETYDSIFSNISKHLLNFHEE
jgi:hypothetical protein